ncbi:MAG: ArgR family transcriptional regulator [Alistipes sp.]|jgi:transcriptional regulator of arginine metabolism|nr:ArgR family transcriptional regulator [Alistipes sp.]
MRNKAERLNLIRRIIGDELISSQEELIKRLEQHGVHATQSTLSRDFKEVNISKMPHPEKGYIYVLSEKLGGEIVSNTANLGDAVLDIRFSHNIAVISTKSGYASAVSVIIDARKSKDIIGTVAGDNNIILILHENTTHEVVFEQMHQLFPTLTYLG